MDYIKPCTQTVQIWTFHLATVQTSYIIEDKDGLTTKVCTFNMV